jgi:hypothetical protein
MHTQIHTHTSLEIYANDRGTGDVNDGGINLNYETEPGHSRGNEAGKK